MVWWTVWYIIVKLSLILRTYDRKWWFWKSRVGYKCDQKHLNENANVSHGFKCKCKCLIIYIYIETHLNANANTFVNAFDIFQMSDQNNAIYICRLGFKYTRKKSIQIFKYKTKENLQGNWPKKAQICILISSSR